MVETWMVLVNCEKVTRKLCGTFIGSVVSVEAGTVYGTLEFSFIIRCSIRKESW